ncbi:MAG TPA: hypothetical protein VGM23_00935 [Armatimonadota bacterium]
MMTRWLIPALLVLCLALQVFAQDPPKNWIPSTIVEIGPKDNPMQMPALQPLLATDAADRLNCQWPEKLTENAYLSNVLFGKFDILKGWWPFIPPPGDPATVTRKDYVDAIKACTSMFASYEAMYGKLNDPIKSVPSCWETIPIYVALWTEDRDPVHLKMVVRSIKIMALMYDDELAKNPTTPPLYNAYWKRELAYVYCGMLPMKDTPEFKEAMTILAASVGKIANDWPLTVARGTHNIPLMAAFWYDLTATYGPQTLSHRKELKAYADTVWEELWRVKDMEEDDPSYTMLDLLLIHAWSQMRGEKWWTDPERIRLFRQYAEQVANDGSWPAYGDGGASGEFLIGVWLGELLASVTGDGHYKWLAHRAFWTARHRMTKLYAQSGFIPYVWLALGAGCADDTIKEVPPKAGVTVPERVFMTLTSN